MKTIKFLRSKIAKLKKKSMIKKLKSHRKKVRKS